MRQFSDARYVLHAEREHADGREIEGRNHIEAACWEVLPLTKEEKKEEALRLGGQEDAVPIRLASTLGGDDIKSYNIKSLAKISELLDVVLRQFSDVSKSYMLSGSMQTCGRSRGGITTKQPAGKYCPSQKKKRKKKC